MRFGPLGLVLTYSSSWFACILVLMPHRFQSSVRHPQLPAGVVYLCIEAEFVRSGTNFQSSSPLHSYLLAGHLPANPSHSFRWYSQTHLRPPG